jgi:hypothetical protein
MKETETRLARRRQKETGVNTTVSRMIQANLSNIAVLSDNIPLDVRGQPPIPFNRSLLDHLELVKDATDPWLLFLWVLCFR